jgi:Tfp pilus assembly protein PilV
MNHWRIIRQARSRRARGFTLAEALIASVVLACGVVGVAGTLATSAQQTRVLEQNTVALNLARQVLEETAATPYASLNGYAGATGSTSTLTSTDGTAVYPSDHDVYSWTVAVEFRSTPSGTVLAGGDYALITVTVTPPNGEKVIVSRLASRATWTM